MQSIHKRVTPPNNIYYKNSVYSNNNKRPKIIPNIIKNIFIKDKIFSTNQDNNKLIVTNSRNFFSDLNLSENYGNITNNNISNSINNGNRLFSFQKIDKEKEINKIIKSKVFCIDNNCYKKIKISRSYSCISNSMDDYVNNNGNNDLNIGKIFYGNNRYGEFNKNETYEIENIIKPKYLENLKKVQNVKTININIDKEKLNQRNLFSSLPAMKTNFLQRCRKISSPPLLISLSNKNEINKNVENDKKRKKIQKYNKNINIINDSKDKHHFGKSKSITINKIIINKSNSEKTENKKKSNNININNIRNNDYINSIKLENNKISLITKNNNNCIKESNNNNNKNINLFTKIPISLTKNQQHREIVLKDKDIVNKDPITNNNNKNNVNLSQNIIPKFNFYEKKSLKRTFLSNHSPLSRNFSLPPPITLGLDNFHLKKILSQNPFLPSYNLDKSSLSHIINITREPEKSSEIELKKEKKPKSLAEKLLSLFDEVKPIKVNNLNSYRDYRTFLELIEKVNERKDYHKYLVWKIEQKNNHFKDSILKKDGLLKIIDNKNKKTQKYINNNINDMFKSKISIFDNKYNKKRKKYIMFPMTKNLKSKTLSYNFSINSKSDRNVVDYNNS